MDFSTVDTVLLKRLYVLFVIEVATLWVPDIRFTSCDLRVFMDQPAESISSQDPPRRRQDNWLAELRASSASQLTTWQNSR